MRTRISNKRIPSVTQKHPEEGLPYYGLSNKHDFKRLSEALQHSDPYFHEFVSQKNALRDIEEDLLIAPVAVLQKEGHSQKIFGVFAKTAFNFYGETRLGEYFGDIKRKKASRFNGDYAFELNEGTTLDAKHRRGWPAMVNATSCYESSNVLAKEIKGRVYYYLIQPIKAGEQLLIYYGDDYTFDDKRFLNPNDNWEESIDKYQKYQEFYDLSQTLDSVLVETLALNADHFAIPDVNHIHECTSVDIPILAYQNEIDFLPQNQQENMTLLMLACWQGHPELVRNLLILGANIYQQTSIHGYSALHFLVLSPHLNFEQKKEILDIIVSYPAAGGLLKLQDLKDNSILHLAIEQQQLTLVDYLLAKDASLSRHDYNTQKSILDCINEEEQDVFVLAMLSSSFDLTQHVLAYLRTKDVEGYLENSDALEDAVTSWVNTYSLTELQARITDISSCLTLREKEKKTFLKLIHQFIPRPSAKNKRDTFFEPKSECKKNTNEHVLKRLRSSS